MSDRSACLDIVCPTCRATPSLRWSTWRYPDRAQPRFACFVGQPLTTGLVTWFVARRVIELDAQRAGRRLTERLR